MTDVTTVGIDLAKNVFSVHGVGAEGAVVLRRSVGRKKLLELIAQLPPSLIGMEACSGAHEWARRFSRLGHRVRLMAPKFVAPYRKSGKNDGNDAEAICEAVARPSMRFVPVKSLEQQADLCLHRVRQGFIEERTATINRLRGLLAEFGHVVPQRAVEVRRQVPALLEQLPSRAARCIADLLEHVRELEARSPPSNARSRGTRVRAPSPNGLRDVRASARSPPRRSSPPSAMRKSSRADDSSPPGSGSSRGSIRPAARPALATSRAAATATCECCS